MLAGDARRLPLRDGSVQCVVTSPPYWGLRKYAGEQEGVWGGDSGCAHEWAESIERIGTGGSTEKQRSNRGQDGAGYLREHGTCVKCGAWRGAYGLEPTVEMYVAHTVEILREIRRVLRPDGVCFWNLGDCYSSGDKNGAAKVRSNFPGAPNRYAQPGLKPKDLCLIPQRVALAAQADGWWVRSVIIWCLSGGTWLYVRTQKGDMPMTVKDVARLNPATVQLWNGRRWTRLRGISRSHRSGDEVELVLRSGERIACTPTHRFPTNRGLLPAGEIRRGDRLQSVQLPEPDPVKDCALDEDAAWLAGLYIAEGSMAGDTIQIAGHAKESERWERLRMIAVKFGGTATRTVSGNRMNIRLYGKVLNAILAELVTGRTAKDKGFAPVVWRYSNRFLASMVDGYLSGDAHRERGRWRLGFCRNYNLERDLRTACARLGYTLTLNLSSAEYKGGRVPTFRGELRKTRSGHRNEKLRTEVVEIRKARCREVYDLGVADEPHVFSLASGVLTHNSKPNPMPESCRDRPTDAFEYILMLTKNAQYFWDAEAVAEKVADSTVARVALAESRKAEAQADIQSTGNGGRAKRCKAARVSRDTYADERDHLVVAPKGGRRNLRNVWTFPTQPYSGAHFATFPEELPRRCILAATSAKGACAQCGKPWERVVCREMKPHPNRWSKTNDAKQFNAKVNEYGKGSRLGVLLESQTIGWVPGCSCYGTPMPPQMPDKPEGIEAPVKCERCGGTGGHVLPLLSAEPVPCDACEGTGWEEPPSPEWVDWQQECSAVERERIAILESIAGLDLPAVPCVVLDPFAGSGTTGRVAIELGRTPVMVDIAYAQPEGYAGLANNRTAGVQREMNW